MPSPPRSSLRGWSILWYVIGFCLLLGGCFFSFGGPFGGGPQGASAASIGASFISIGFLLSLFARLEERVMHVEQLLGFKEPPEWRPTPDATPNP